MKSYLLRDIPEELWNRAKHRAIDDGDSLRDLILKSVESYLITPKMGCDLPHSGTSRNRRAP